MSLETNEALPLTSKVTLVQPQDSFTESVVQSSSRAGTSVENSEGPIQELIGTISYIVNEKQIIQLFKLSGKDSEKTKKCLVYGPPTLASVLTLLNERFSELPRRKLSVDLSDAWSDIVAYYKCKTFDYETQLRVNLDGHSTIDTGGVRRQVYTLAYEAFATNQFIRLFDGPEHHLRPAYSAEARSSGLLKILGGMISHSICQEGVGFPYLSPTCFWYIVGGEEKAIQFASVEDLPADSRFVISEVCFSVVSILQ